MAKIRHTKADTLHAIKGLKKSGKALNYYAVRQSHGSLLVRARQQFGSWRKAITAAGLDYEKISLICRWSKKEIVRQIQELHQAKQFPDISTLARKSPKLYEACCRHYGSGLAALKAAGINYDELLQDHPYRWTRATIIAEIKRRHSDGKTLCRADILRKEPVLKRFCYAATHQFGGWSKALLAAKLSPNTIRNRDGLWPRERVLAGIRSRFKQGKFLNTDLMLREDLPLHAAGRRHFGTWKKAVEKAGINYKHIRGGLLGWTKPKTRSALRERVRHANITQAQLRDRSPSLYRAAIHHFGSWTKALHEARK